MMNFQNKPGKVVFAIGTGRCGTKFLHKVLFDEKNIASYHERHPLNDTFHRFCKWYNIECDDSGFIETKRREIIKDLNSFQISFEASAYLSLSIIELYKYFNAKFILLIRSPEKVINSYIRKGWYDHQYFYNPKNGKIPTFQPENKMFHHFLGRTVPYGEDFESWNKLTRVGKLAWYWKTLNELVLDQFSKIPSENFRIQQIEKLDYNSYLNFCDFIGYKATVSEKKFNKFIADKPNSNIKLSKKKIWTAKEWEEFNAQLIADTLAKFGYQK